LFSVLNETSRITTSTMGKTRSTAELRLVVDQLLRELQSAVDDNSRQCFFASSNATAIELHFLATIDNNTGNEDAEIHYYYRQSEGKLYKDMEFWTIGGSTNSMWNTTSSTWYSGASGPTWPTNYIAVLDNIKSLRIQYSVSENSGFQDAWNYTTSSLNNPGFVQITFVYCDLPDVIRYRGIANVPSYLWRTNRSIVYLPRRV
jgi:hypothetical protein